MPASSSPAPAHSPTDGLPPSPFSFFLILLPLSPSSFLFVLLAYLAYGRAGAPADGLPPSLFSFLILLLPLSPSSFLSPSSWRQAGLQPRGSHARGALAAVGQTPCRGAGRDPGRPGAPRPRQRQASTRHLAAGGRHSAAAQAAGRRAARRRPAGCGRQQTAPASGWDTGTATANYSPLLSPVFVSTQAKMKTQINN